jgi:hypothetical protein
MLLEEMIRKKKMKSCNTCRHYYIEKCNDCKLNLEDVCFDCCPF